MKSWRHPALEVQVASKTAWTAALWAGASVAAAAVALLVSHYLKIVLENGNAPQETLAQGEPLQHTL